MADQNKVQWVYAAKSLDELSTKYDEWAADYDADLERDFGWRGHVAAVDTFLKYVTTDSRVMDVGVGTGLGLSIFHQIVHDHRGQIKVDSEPGKGSTFTTILSFSFNGMGLGH